MAFSEAAGRVPAPGVQAASDLGLFGSLLERLRPPDGWLSLAFLIVNLLVVVLSVEQADWAPTPSLAATLLLGMLTASVLYRLPVWAGVVLVFGIALGALTITWQMSAFEFDGRQLQGASELFERLGLWSEAARDGSISIDQVPFSFGLVCASWLTGFLGAWLFLRHRNFWGVFILGGIGLFSNLTFLPPNVSFHMAIYLFSALLLVARVQAVRRVDEWRRRNIRHDEHMGALTISDSFFLAAAVIVIAFLLPTSGARWSAATSAYESLRSPLASFEGDFNRLFAGLPARRPMGFRIWDNVMAFQGTINPTTTQVLQVESPVEMYWKARTYDTYTSKGWVSQHTEFQPLGFEPAFAAERTSRDRAEVTYTVLPLYDSKSLFSGDQVVSVSREVQIETSSPPEYTVRLTQSDPLAGYPPALAEAGRALAQKVQLSGGVVTEDDLTPLLPPDFTLQELVRNDGLVIGAVLLEALPSPADVLAVRSPNGEFDAKQAYQVTSSVSFAEADELRDSGEQYPVYVEHRFTQLPNSLPARVRELAEEIAAKGDTPYDKAQAIEAYLKQLTYTLNLQPPPFNADGVDHFLFDQQQGYSEYFASSMAVMLRSVGIPTRLAVGYTVGDPIENFQGFAVTDSHSHAWVEVYMPGYGWLPFEPTPGAELPAIYKPGSELVGGAANPFLDDFLDDCLEFIEACGDEDLLDPDLRDAGPTGGGVAALGGLSAWLIGFLAALVVALAVGLWCWKRFMAVSAVPGDVYRRLSALARLGALGQASYQTPYQFGGRLIEAMPQQREQLSVVVDSYVRSRYANRQPTPQDGLRLAGAWRGLRFPLLRRILWRGGL